MDHVGSFEEGPAEFGVVHARPYEDCAADDGLEQARETDGPVGGVRGGASQ
jgi:hypothetical protein